jgi:hypothetical protein
MNEDQIIGLLVDGGPGAVAALDAWIAFKTMEMWVIAGTMVTIICIMGFIMRKF